MSDMNQRVLRFHLLVHAIVLGFAIVGVLKLAWPSAAPYPAAVALVFALAWLGGYPAYRLLLGSREERSPSFAGWSAAGLVIGSAIFVVAHVLR